MLDNIKSKINGGFRPLYTGLVSNPLDEKNTKTFKGSFRPLYTGLVSNSSQRMLGRSRRVSFPSPIYGASFKRGKRRREILARVFKFPSPIYGASFKLIGLFCSLLVNGCFRPLYTGLVSNYGYLNAYSNPNLRVSVPYIRG